MAVRALRRRDFAVYFVGNLVSNCGTWFGALSMSILVFRLTHSALLLGVVNFAQFIAVLLLAPWAGGAADRYDRRRLLVTTQVVSAAVNALLAALAWVGAASTAVVVVLALVLGAATGIAMPAMQAFVPALVEPEDLPAAIAMNSVTFTLARAVGPATAALAIARLGIPAAFALDVASFAPLLVALALVRPRPRAAAAAAAARPGFRDSLRLLRRDARVALLVAVLATVAFSSDPVSTLAPAFAKRVFHHADTLSGALIGVFGAGAVCAVFVVGRLALPVTLALLGGGVAAFALAPSLPFAFVALAIGGFGYLATNTAAATRLQLGAADHERGRVMALWSASFLGLRPFASLLDGGLAAGLGVRVAGTALAVPALGVAALLAARALGRD